MDPLALPSHPVPLPATRSVGFALVLGWFVPGLGHAYAGQPLKGAIFLVAVLPLFVLGWALTHFTAVNPADHPLDFVAQIFLGGPTVAATFLTKGRILTELPTWLEEGRLFVRVAGLLNLIALCDAVGEVIAWNRRADALGAAEERRQEELWAQAEARAAFEATAPDDEEGYDLDALGREDLAGDVREPEEQEAHEREERERPARERPERRREERDRLPHREEDPILLPPGLERPDDEEA